MKTDKERGIQKMKINNTKVMCNRVWYTVPTLWLKSFRNQDKIKVLNSYLRYSKRPGRTPPNSNKWYMDFIEHFYYDKDFNNLYTKWKLAQEEGESEEMLKLMRPSLDHITPIADGGTWDIDNLQFMTFYENYCKYTIRNWEVVKYDLIKSLFGKRTINNGWQNDHRSFT